MNMKGTIQKDNFYKNITTILLTVIAIFGVYSLILLNTVNQKLNDLKTNQAIQNTRMERAERDIERLKIKAGL